MERSVHIRNGKVQATDRKLQIGNFFGEGKMHVDWFNIFEFLKICLMANPLFEGKLLLLPSFSQTDLFVPQISFYSNVHIVSLQKNNKVSGRICYCLFSNLNFLRGKQTYEGRQFINIKKMSSIFKNSSVYRYIKPWKNYQSSEEQPVDIVSI